MSNKTTIEDIKNSYNFKNIVEKYKPMCIFIGGSRLMGIEEEDSDFDVIAVIRGSAKLTGLDSFICPSAHIYLLDYDNIVSTFGVHWDYIFCDNIRDNLLYSTDETDLVIDMFSNKYLGIKMRCESLNDEINWIIRENTFDETQIHRGKMYYGLILGTKMINEEEIDKEYILQIKDIYKGIDKDRFIADLKEVRELYFKIIREELWR